jgi:hypothetical protein
MTDRPIIFSAPMVRALLDGSKTQTRRLAWKYTTNDPVTGKAYGLTASPWQAVQPGDRLWVREACRATQDGAVAAVEYRAATDEEFGDTRWIENTEAASQAWCALYAYRQAGRDGVGAWVPSIHMPRWASRLTLTVTAVRVEPLWAMTEADAIAEGVTPSAQNRSGHPLTPHLAAFSDLWLQLHDYTVWASNPEVAVISFDVAHRNIDA